VGGARIGRNACTPHDGAADPREELIKSVVASGELNRRLACMHRYTHTCTCTHAYAHMRAHAHHTERTAPRPRRWRGSTGRSRAWRRSSRAWVRSATGSTCKPQNRCVRECVCVCACACTPEIQLQPHACIAT